ncbi:hypothetical protein AMECASPLE_014050 [Ameca splendens]|uniref:Uncharacterized protein n=1 Tax=Ameca splendens TaxID=208324 RepID=A0ABV1A7U1_9TELE
MSQLQHLHAQTASRNSESQTDTTRRLLCGSSARATDEFQAESNRQMMKLWANFPASKPREESTSTLML